MKTSFISLLFIGWLHFSVSSIVAAEPPIHGKREIGKSVLLTIRAADQLPKGAIAEFQVKASRTHVVKPDLVASRMAGLKEQGYGRADLTKEGFAPEVITVSRIVDEYGFFQSHIATFNFSEGTLNDDSKINIILVEVEATLRQGSQVLLSQTTEFPVLLKGSDTDLIPVCVSITKRENSKGSPVFGLSRSPCESERDPSKLKAIPKS